MKKRLISLALCLVLALGLLPATALSAGAVYTPYGDVPRVIIDGVNYYDIFRSASYNPIERSDEMTAIFEQALTHYIEENLHLQGDPRYDSVVSNWNDVAHALYIADDANISIDGDSGHSFNERHWKIMDNFSAGVNNNDSPFFVDKDGNPKWTHDSNAYQFPREAWVTNRNIYSLPNRYSSNREDGGVFASSGVEDLANDLAYEIGDFFEDVTGAKNHDDFVYLTSQSGDEGREKLVELLKNEGVNETGPLFFSTQSVMAEYNNNGMGDEKDDVQMITWGAIFYDLTVEYLDIDVSSAVSAIDTTGMTGTRELYDYVQEQSKAGNTVPGITYEITTDDPTFSVGGVNQSSQPVDLTISYGTSVSESATNGYSHSKEFGFTESLGLTQEFKTDGMFGKFASSGTSSGTTFSWSLSVGFEATQMFSETWDNSETFTSSSESLTSSTVELPAHTQILLSTGEGRTAYSMEYDAPIAIRYKTLLFGSYFNHTGEDGIHGETFKILGNFGNSDLATGENAQAAGNLYNRFHGGKNYESMYGGDIDWTKVLSDPWTQDDQYYNLVTTYSGSSSRHIYAVDLEQTVNDIYAHQPYTVTGGDFSANVKSTNTTIYGLEPLYPLRKVTSDKAFDYQLVVGDELYLDNIPLYGYNDANVPYYGFDPSKGEWKIVDETGAEVSSDVISVTVNPLTGYTTLKAIGAGTAYVQYFIDENVYKSANSVGETENVSVDRVAIPITVTNEIFENGTIAVSGELVGYVGEELAIDTVLTAQIKDAEGKYQDRAITWELQEISGASITDNRITFTRPGAYHVRAVCGNVKSHVTDPWYEITALDAKALSEITVSADSPMILNSDTLDLSGLQFAATAVDQYGQAWADDAWKNSAEWVLDGTAVSGNVLTDLTEGDHTLILNYNGVASNEIILRVVLDTPVVSGLTPAETSLPYSGGILEFTLIGENLVDGMTVRAVSGATTLTAATSGSDTTQTALMEFPANPSSADIMTYEVSVGGQTASVIVSKAPATDESEELDLAAFKAQFKAASLTLTDNIAINFKAQVTEPEGNTADYTVGALFWTSEPSAYTILGNPALQIEKDGVNGEFYRLEDASGYHVFSYDEIAAKEMNDTIYAVAYVKTGGRYIYSKPLSYSVVQYANAVLNGSYSDEFKTLAVDMLNYGAEAQTYFGYRTDALANAGLTAEQQALGTQSDVELANGQQKFGTASDYVGFTSASLSLESYVSLNYKASVAPMSGYAIDNVNLFYAPAFTDEAAWITDRDAGTLSQVTMTNNGTAWTGAVRDIVAKGLRDSFYTQVQVTYTNGSETVAEYSDILQFSVADFAYLAQQNGSDALQALTQSLMKYGDSAKAYFETLN